VSASTLGALLFAQAARANWATPTASTLKYCKLLHRADRYSYGLVARAFDEAGSRWSQGITQKAMSAISHRIARSESASTPSSSATYRMGAASVSECPQSAQRPHDRGRGRHRGRRMAKHTPRPLQNRSATANRARRETTAQRVGAVRDGRRGRSRSEPLPAIPHCPHRTARATPLRRVIASPSSACYPAS
jgi:hypothetical protein